MGTDIIFLDSTSDTGQIGRVLGEPWTDRGDGFYVRMRYDKQGHARVVRPEMDLFLDERLFSVPSWMPPFSIEDDFALHKAMLSDLIQPARLNANSIKSAVQGMIWICWAHRLPVRAETLWPMLAAHDVAASVRSRLVDYVDFGIDLLVATQGRKPIKRKRMPALSKGRYLSENQRALRMKLFGHD